MRRGPGSNSATTTTIGALPGCLTSARSKGTYLFVNRQGKKVGEYSLYQLAREFRCGRASMLDAVPLFDRAMGSLVGALRATTSPA